MENSHSSHLNPVEALDQFAPTQQKHALPSAQANIQVLRFGVRLGDFGLLLDAGVSSQVLSEARVSQIPLTPDWFSGVTNVRGNLVPVFNLHALLEVTDEPLKTRSTHRQLLLLDKDAYRVAFFIHALPQRVNTDHPLQQPLPLPTSLQGFVARSYSDRGQTWLAWDHRAFFTRLGAGLAQ